MRPAPPVDRSARFFRRSPYDGVAQPKASAKQPVLMQLLEPLRVVDVDLAAWNVPGIPRIDEQYVEPRSSSTSWTGTQTISPRTGSVDDVCSIDPVCENATERRRDHALLKSPTFVRDSQAWRKKHAPDAGYIPDRPGSRG